MLRPIKNAKWIAAFGGIVRETDHEKAYAWNYRRFGLTECGTRFAAMVAG
jgi:hypothetical protein